MKSYVTAADINAELAAMDEEVLFPIIVAALHMIYLDWQRFQHCWDETEGRGEDTPIFTYNGFIPWW